MVAAERPLFSLVPRKLAEEVLLDYLTKAVTCSEQVIDQLVEACHCAAEAAAVPSTGSGQSDCHRKFRIDGDFTVLLLWAALVSLQSDSLAVHLRAELGSPCGTGGLPAY